MYENSPKSHLLEPPRYRSMNTDPLDDFVAIDFETMTPLKTSACSIGMIKVIDGEIVQQFYSIINPVRDEYTDREPNRLIHGISIETAEKAMTFPEIFPYIKLFIGDFRLVCHNKATDIGIIEALMAYYGLSGLNTHNTVCTYEETGLSLKECCKKYMIPLDHHHNALADAEACARIYLHLIGKPLIEAGGIDTFKGCSSTRSIAKRFKTQLEDEQIVRKDTIFYNSKVVITGIFDSFQERDELAAILQKLGAKINGSISKKTTHVVVGREAGPKKIDKIKELKSMGVDIEIITENKLLDILAQK